MRVERWQQIDALFEAALERRPDERPAFLDSACGGDHELRREVESLLAAAERADDFIEAPAMEIAAREYVSEQVVTDVGRRLGPYQILSLLGAGGMGEVFLARDTRLGRAVALKLLPEQFTSNPERVRRFEHEARAASALNHPNIITIHDIGREDGRYYLTAEFIDGQTLRRLMKSKRPDLTDVLRIAVQVADALAAAHAAGLVHRDIKPENIMVRPDGYVKVLDFGLVKLSEEFDGPSATQGLSAPAHTETGAVLGTVAYMSPEQALGMGVDHRTDIFSFGVVLYELITGRHPFKGATTAATFDAILHHEPSPPADANNSLPSALGSILARALEKDRELRYQTISDLRAELERLQRALLTAEEVSGAARAAHPQTRAILSARGVTAALSLLVLVALASAGYLAFRRRGARTEAAPAAPPQLTGVTQLTDRAGPELFPSLAPDGKWVAYAARDSGNWDIYVQRVGGRAFNNLTADSSDDDTHPAFSPDGQSIAFRSERQPGGLFVMGATGESVRRLTDFGYHPAWSPDGREIVFSTENIRRPSARRLEPSLLWVVNVATGETRQLTDGRLGDAAQPQWSPNGLRVAYWGKHRGGQRDIWTVSGSGGAPVPVTDDAHVDWYPVWSPDGKFIYFSSDRGGSMNLWRVPIDESSGRVSGAPEPLTMPSTYGQHLTFAREGRRAAYVNQVSSTNIMAAPFNPAAGALAGSPSAVTRGFKRASAPDLSPDGRWFVYSTQGEKQEDLFLIPRDGAGPPRQLTNDSYNDRTPVWSPDGARIAFYSDRSGKYEAWTIRPDGSGLQRLTYTEGASVAYPFWSPDGSRLAFNRRDESCSIIEAAKSWQEQTPQTLPLPPDRRLGAFWASSWSPNGRKLGGWSGPLNETPGIVIYTFETGSFERVTDFGSHPIWFKDNQRLLFGYEDRLYVVNSKSRKVRELLPASLDAVAGYGLSRDNRLLFYGLTTTEADIWVLDLE